MTGTTEALLLFPDGIEELHTVTHLGGDRYRLDTSPVLSECATFGDVISASVSAPGRLQVLQVVQRSPYNTVVWAISPEVAESAQLVEFLDLVVASGGAWERVFGGLLYLHTPLLSDIDLSCEYERIVRRRLPRHTE